jgi:LCP family protein required for cell wall assembly
MEIKKPKKAWSTKKKIIFFTFMALLAALIGVTAKWIYDVSNPSDLFVMATTPTPDAVQSDATPAGDATPEGSPTLSPEELLEQDADAGFMKNRVNVLMLGLDRSAERENWGSFRTDTMILVSIDFDNNKVDMISIPRDSYVRIYKKENFGKVNTAFGAGGGFSGKGYEYACKTISMLMGNISVDYYVGFDMTVVKNVVDIIGGVDYNVDIEVSMNGRTLHPGYQHLDGQGVLDYCRQRKGSSDVARVQRQQKMLMAIFEKMMSANQLGNIPSIYNQIQENIDTNLSFTQISALALMALRINSSDIATHYVEGQFLDMDSLSYWGISTSKLKKLVKDVFGINMSVDSEIDVYNIKEKLEQLQAELAVYINAANSAMNEANTLINSGTISEQSRATLTQLISDCQAAIDTAEAEAIQTATAQLQSAITAAKSPGIGVVTPSGATAAPDPMAPVG